MTWAYFRPIIQRQYSSDRATVPVVRAYCAQVGIPYVPEALQWKPKVLPSWERTARWHASVSESSGFEPRRSDGAVDVESHPRLRAYLRYHRPYYERLHARRLRV